MMSSEGMVFCVYQTPCWYCSKFDKECNQKKYKSKSMEELAKDAEPILDAAGEYAVRFARHHGISIEEAMEKPMVKARFEVFNKIGL